MHKAASLRAYWIAVVFMAGVSFFYYPKWNKPHTEAMISWDVSGYYWYLPATFIYRDLKGLGFSEAVIQRYMPAPGFDQAFLHPSGSHVLKYSAGMALNYLPAFAVAHALAQPLGYEADGFSAPYQLALQCWCLLWACWGLWWLRRILLAYFSEGVTASVLLLYVFGTNYLNYAAIDVAMPHQWLFGWQCLLIYASMRFHRTPSMAYAALIGVCIGMAALSRPTEALMLLIPLLWGGARPNRAFWLERIAFLKRHATKVALAAAVMGGIGSIQLLYWKYVSGDWVVYSYQDQGFTWLPPHLIDYLFSYRSGWLIYTPMMLFSLFGLRALWKSRSDNALALATYSVLALYVVSAWDIWWYGGRAMIQSYPALAFPLAAFLTQTLSWGRAFRLALWTVFGLLIYYNLWYTHQLHRGGLVYAFDMTRAYFWKVLGRYNVPPETVRYLDTNDVLRSECRDVRTVYANDFEQDSALTNPYIGPIEGRFSEYIHGEKHATPEYSFPLSPDDGQWLQASALIHTPQKEWDVWQMTHFTVKFMQDDKVVHERGIRVHRLLNDGETKNVGFDIKIPKKAFNKASVLFWNGHGQKTVAIDQLKVEVCRVDKSLF